MTGFIVSVFPFRNRVSSKEAFEGLELGEGKPSRPVLRGPGGRKAAWLLGSNPFHQSRGPPATILPQFPRRLQFQIEFALKRKGKVVDLAKSVCNLLLHITQMRKTEAGLTAIVQDRE